jgi:hypothetical protein
MGFWESVATTYREYGVRAALRTAWVLIRIGLIRRVIFPGQTVVIDAHIDGGIVVPGGKAVLAGNSIVPCGDARVYRSDDNAGVVLTSGATISTGEWVEPRRRDWAKEPRTDLEA